MLSAIEVARELRLHPANLILYMASQGASLEETWPTCNPDWVAALKSAYWERFGEHARPRNGSADARRSAPSEDGLSEIARRILAKMAAKRNYATNTVSFETVKKHYGSDHPDAEAAIEELLRRGLLITDSRRGPYRLDPGRTGEIERLTGFRT
ncbi:MAG TPA: hypothetical protein PLB02_06340 [Thermoanaerobaculia bacterium]|nr:hypothetical protein [Thermoanaerobaculia bacterium]HQR66996.1 hypothetical protein [Thermoanaerobaculia bacterium]